MRSDETTGEVIRGVRSLARQLSRRAVRRARIESGCCCRYWLRFSSSTAIDIRFLSRSWDTAVRGITAIAVLSLGWQLARDVGRAFGPTLLRRMEPGTAAPVGFLIRLATMCDRWSGLAQCAHVPCR